MLIERSGRRYELLHASDVVHDTVYLELNDVTSGESHTVLFGEKSDSREYRFLSCANRGASVRAPLLVPVELVEEFIQ